MQAVKEQIIASNPNYNIWLSANAGTGKTHVLINRLLRLILNNTQPDKIICITYTTAAATEIQNRIIEYAQKWIISSDEEILKDFHAISGDNTTLSKQDFLLLREKLGLILDFPERLKIQTIHSFCQSILKSFPLEANIAPFFSVMDEIEKNELIDTAINSTINDFTVNQEGEKSNLADAIYRLLNNYSPFTIKSNLKNLIYERIKISQTLSNYPSLYEYSHYLSNVFELPSTNKQELVIDFAERNLARLEYLGKAYLQASKSHIHKSEIINEFLKNKNFSTISPIFLTSELKNRETIINKKLSDNDDKLKFIITNLQEDFQVLYDRIKSINLYNSTRDFLTIFQNVNSVFEELKKQKYLLDYDDLIEKTHQLFSNKNNLLREWILYKLDGGIDHILLDEAQDTNPHQWEVIKTITEEFFSSDETEGNHRTLFVVGDEKQSIYSFQGADFRTFDQMKNFFKNKIEICEKINFAEINLNLSFRSCPAILNIVDEVLQQDGIKNSVTINPEQNINHTAFRNKHFGYFEINPLIGEKKTKKKKDRISWELPTEYEINNDENNKQLVAEKVVSKINKLIKDRRILPSTGKEIQPKDFMILVRKRKGNQVIKEIISRLEQLGIAVSGMDRLNLKDNMAIQDLLSYAKFKLLPTDDLNLANLLKSPFFEITENELFQLSWDRKNLSLFDNLKIHANFNQRFKDILDNLSKTLSSSKNETALSFFLRIIDEPNNRINFVNYYGHQINEIFDEFTNLIFHFESKNNNKLQSFISWIENNNSEIKRNQEAQKNEVRILTIHGSKGLQAPIVIMPDTTSSSKSKHSTIIDENLILCGINKNSKNSISNSIINHLDTLETYEDKRLLYVALTRAKDEMYIYGDKSDQFEKEYCWYNIIKNAAKNICQTNENETLFLTNEEYLKDHSSKNHNIINSHTENFALPDFIKKNNKNDQANNSNLNFKLNNNTIKSSNKKIEKGLFIHKLLEILPSKNEDKWPQYIKIISKNYKLNDQEIESLSQEAINTIKKPEFSFIFQNESNLEETEICGYIENEKLIHRKIDKIINNNKNELIIIDYKTTDLNKQEAETLAKNHKKQLDEYEELLQNIYPKKEIKKAILFTYNNSLIYI